MEQTVHVPTRSAVALDHVLLRTDRRVSNRSAPLRSAPFAGLAATDPRSNELALVNLSRARVE
jgi:hypothetical protein